MDVPAEAASHRPTVGQFRVFKPPAGVSTWDSSPFIESPFTEAPAQARRDGLPLPDSAGHRPRKPRLAAQPWPLLAVLLVQAALSLRLAWSNTAFQDEALYLRAGHLEWARWLHNAPIPNFPAYFSGAPVLYPPLGALADSVGGLTAARLLSLGFMLGVTTLLWATAARLYGQRAALLATALFATLAGAQFLGAFATYDAMALFLLALAAWLGVRSADCQPGTRAILLITTGVLLAAADAVKYATALFTPVVIVVVAMTVWRKRRGRRGACGRPDRARLMAPGGHRGYHGRRPGLLAGHHHEHPGPAAVERSGHRGASPGLRVDEPHPGPGRPGCGAGLSQGSTREAAGSRSGGRRLAGPGGAGQAAHHGQPPEARRVRGLVRRDRRRVCDGPAEQSRSWLRLGTGHGPADRRIDPVRVDGPGHLAVRGLAKLGRGREPAPRGDRSSSRPLPGRGL